MASQDWSSASVERWSAQLAKQWEREFFKGFVSLPQRKLLNPDRLTTQSRWNARKERIALRDSLATTMHDQSTKRGIL